MREYGDDDVSTGSNLLDQFVACGVSVNSIVPPSMEPKALLIKSLTLDGMLLESAPEKFRDDQGVVLAAVSQNGRAIAFASPHCQSLPFLMRETLKQTREHGGPSQQDDTETDKVCAPLSPPPPHHTTPHHTKPHHTKPHHTTPHHTTPHHTTPHHTTPHHSTLHPPLHTIPLHTTPHHITSRHTTQLRSTPHHTTPHHTTPHHTTPHHSTPNHTTPHHTTPHHSTPHNSAQHHTTPHHTTPHRTTSLRTTPHHTIPHRTTPHHTTPSCHGRGETLSPPPTPSSPTRPALAYRQGLATSLSTTACQPAVGCSSRKWRRWRRRTPSPLRCRVLLRHCNLTW
jgi:hypothetical protein